MLVMLQGGVTELAVQMYGLAAVGNKLYLTDVWRSRSMCQASRSICKHCVEKRPVHHLFAEMPSVLASSVAPFSTWISTVPL